MPNCMLCWILKREATRYEKGAVIIQNLRQPRTGGKDYWQGKARPWILFAAPLMFVCMILLFVVPRGNDNLTALWIFTSYTVFYAVAYTMYSTAHTLMVPLATRNEEERRSLSTIANTPGMAAGSLVAILFPCVIVPTLGVSETRWVTAAIVIAVFSFPLMLLEFFFTRERVNTAVSNPDRKVSLSEQLHCCVKSRSWVLGGMLTISGGIALCIFNFGISRLGYQASADAVIPVQNDQVQGFLIFCVIGVQLIAYPLIGILTRFFPKEKMA